MASRCTTRMLGICAALLASCAANAALLSDTGPSRLPLPDRLLPRVDTADRTAQLLTGWGTDAQPSGTTGGALGPTIPTWLPEETPTGPDGGQNFVPSFDLRPMLGGLGAELRGGSFEAARDQVAPVPLPASLWLLASGAAAVMPLLRRGARRTSLPRGWRVPPIFIRSIKQLSAASPNRR